MIVGLGNPGDDYVGTRHNVGFGVIDLLGLVLGIDVKKKKFGACFGEGRFGDFGEAGEINKLILLKPWHFMNRSGQAVATASGFYKVAVADMLVISDDMDLECGRVRIRAKGSAGGHNGLADIIDRLGTSDFARLRIGIGRSELIPEVAFVLGRPSKDEKEKLDMAVELAREAALCWVRNGVRIAMNEFNG